MEVYVQMICLTRERLYFLYFSVGGCSSDMSKCFFGISQPYNFHIFEFTGISAGLRNARKISKTASISGPSSRIQFNPIRLKLLVQCNFERENYLLDYLVESL